MGIQAGAIAIAKPRGPSGRNRLAWSLLSGSVLPIATAFGFLAWIGWFGGPLYIVVQSAAPRPRIVAVLLSGDMGFRIGMGPRIAERLAARGIPVVGVNSLTFFRRPRSAAEAAGLVEGGMKRAAALAPSARIVLIGQSLGADMLQVGLGALPVVQRRRVALVALVVPGREVRLQASPSELLPMSSPSFSGVATARRLTWVPTLCVQGADETDSLCPVFHQRNVERVALPGGHPLRRDADRLAATLLAAVHLATGPGKAFDR